MFSGGGGGSGFGPQSRQREKAQPSLPVLGLLKAATPAAAAFLSRSCRSSRSSWTRSALSACFTADFSSSFVVFDIVCSFLRSFTARAGLKSSWAGLQVQSCVSSSAECRVELTSRRRSGTRSEEHTSELQSL